MWKKFLSVLICIFAILTLASCTAEKDDKKEQQEQNDDAVKNEDVLINEDVAKIDINVKPLEEVDEETLANSASSLGFENENLFHAFANAIGKKPQEVTQEDVDKVHFIAVGPEKEYEYSVFVGYIDYVDLCLSDETDNPDFAAKLSEKVMMSEFNYNIETDSLSDLGNFKNVEMFEIYDVAIEDVSFIRNYNKLVFGFFRNNGITDVSGLDGYNPQSLVELDFTGNEIDDWKPVDAIKNKVIVFYDMSTGFRINLESFLEQQETAITVPSPEQKEESAEEKDEQTENDEYLIVDENGNPTDFSSLFD